jgi:hypothetical protein
MKPKRNIFSFSALVVLLLLPSFQSVVGGDVLLEDNFAKLPADSLDDDGKPMGVNLPGNTQPYHVVDGGYYENSGVGALMAWLNQGLDELVQEKKKLPKEILIITIGAFPPEGKNKNPRYAGRRLSIFQFEAPFLTLEGLQGQAHPAGAFRELQLLQQRWHSSDVKLTTVNFRFQGAQPPLSWHLRDCDKENIKKGWETLPERDKNLSTIDEFLMGMSSKGGEEI